MARPFANANSQDGEGFMNPTGSDVVRNALRIYGKNMRRKGKFDKKWNSAGKPNIDGITLPHVRIQDRADL